MSSEINRVHIHNYVVHRVFTRVLRENSRHCHSPERLSCAYRDLTAAKGDTANLSGSLFASATVGCAGTRFIGKYYRRYTCTLIVPAPADNHYGRAWDIRTRGFVVTFVLYRSLPYRSDRRHHLSPSSRTIERGSNIHFRVAHYRGLFPVALVILKRYSTSKTYK